MPREGLCTEKRKVSTVESVPQGDLYMIIVDRASCSGANLGHSDVLLELKQMVVLIVGEEFSQIFSQVQDVLAIRSSASFRCHNLACHFDKIIGSEVQLVLLICNASQRHHDSRAVTMQGGGLNLYRNHSERVAIVDLSLLEILDSSGDGRFSVNSEHDSVRKRVGLFDKGGDTSWQFLITTMIRISLIHSARPSNCVRFSRRGKCEAGVPNETSVAENPEGLVVRGKRFHFSSS